MRKEGDNLSVLIPDGEWELLANHVKDCFSEVSDIDLYIMSNKKYVPIRYSRHIYHFSYYPKTENKVDWISNINKEITKYDIDLVMPIYEEGIRDLVEYKEHIKDISKVVILPSLEMFDVANNKNLLAKHLKTHGIPCPKTFDIVPENATGIDDVDFPIIAKPIEGTEGGVGIQVFGNREELKKYFGDNIVPAKFLFQKFINGYDIDCSVLCKEGEIKAFTIQKGNLYGKGKYSPAIGLDFLYEQRLYGVVKKLMETLNWSGVAHIDLRYDESDGEFKVIEINTRFWGSLDASLIAGVNFPYLYCLLCNHTDFKIPHYEHIEVLSLKGFLKRSKQNLLLMAKIRFIWNNTSLKHAIKDPFHFLVKMMFQIGYFLRRLIKKDRT